MPIIMYSGNLTKELGQKDVDLGATAVLDKPYDFSNLSTLVAQTLEST